MGTQWFHAILQGYNYNTVHILLFYAHTEMFGTVYSMDHGYLNCISISIVQVVVWGGVTVGYLELQQNYDISET